MYTDFYLPQNTMTGNVYKYSKPIYIEINALLCTRSVLYMDAFTKGCVI